MNAQWIRGLMLAAASGWAGMALGEGEETLETVDRVNIERYMGRWYEIARLPNRFQDECARDVQALYTLRDDRKIDIYNTCVRADGNLEEGKGVARVKDRTTNAVLDVSFVRILGIRIYWGGYWIIGLDDEYRYAVVGSPDRRFGWILSRTPELEPPLLAEATKVLHRQGYELDRFQYTSHASASGDGVSTVDAFHDPQ